MAGGVSLRRHSLGRHLGNDLVILDVGIFSMRLFRVGVALDLLPAREEGRDRVDPVSAVPPVAIPANHVKPRVDLV